MHPIERLRYVARAGDIDPSTLAIEAADALSDLGFDAAALVVAARRLLDAHLDCGPLWWVAAHVLCADDPVAAAREKAMELAHDPTADELAAGLPGGSRVVVVPTRSLRDACAQRPDLTVQHYEYGYDELVLVDESDEASIPIVLASARAASTHGLLLRAEAAQFLHRARTEGARIWVVAEVGSILPPTLYDACCQRLHDAGRLIDSSLVSSHSDRALSHSFNEPECSLVAVGDVDVIVTERGPAIPNGGTLTTTCPVPGELCINE